MTDTPDPFAHLRNPTAFAKWKAECFARAGRFQGYYKKPKPLPHNPATFIRQGGMKKLEYVAGAAAADQAIRLEQRVWYPTLKRWLADPNLHPFERGYLERELKRLRRILGIKQSAKDKRAKTRERVRLHRSRKGAQT